MAVWIPVGDGFIEADVIRWKEPVFRTQRRGRAARVGDRMVFAEVLRESDADGWVYLLVRSSEVLSAKIGWSLSDVLLPAKGTETKRQLGTIVRGDPERLLWSDESARAVVASRFLGNRDPALAVSGDTQGKFARRLSRKPASRMKKKRPGKAGRGSPRLHA
ncbi:MAG TPA: hypothetical protein VHW66_22345 [Stellaceae bacterium]|jgi:hypothetical protein|nr:hypothetical protein [Stellaceae bacterium]